MELIQPIGVTEEGKTQKPSILRCMVTCKNWGDKNHAGNLCSTRKRELTYSASNEYAWQKMNTSGWWAHIKEETFLKLETNFTRCMKSSSTAYSF